MKYYKHVHDRKMSVCPRNISNPFMLTTFVLQLVTVVLCLSSLLVNECFNNKIYLRKIYGGQKMNVHRLLFRKNNLGTSSYKPWCGDGRLSFFKCCSEIFEVTDLKKIAKKITFVTSLMVTQVTDFIKMCYKSSPHDMVKALFLAGNMF
jgi:hypothetical protein